MFSGFLKGMVMERRIFNTSLLAAAGSFLLPGLSTAAPKTIRIIVPFTAGSGSDEGARFYAEKLGEILNRIIVVENKPGASGLIAVKTVLAEPADGNTVLLASNSVVSVNPAVNPNLGYDPFKEIVPVHGMGISSVAMISGKGSDINEIKDIQERYRIIKAPLAVGNYSDGYRLISEWLSQALGVEVSPVNYKGGSPMVTDIIGNRLEMGLNDIGGILQMYRSGKLNVLATTGNKRDKELPKVPTMMELGYKDFETYVWTSLYMKKGTDAGWIKEFAAAVEKFQASDAGKAYEASRPGGFLSISMDEMGEFQRKEFNRFKSILEKSRKV